MFIISLTYKKPLPEIDKHAAGHLAFLDKYFAVNKFIISGRKNPRTGGVILAYNTTRAELESIIKEDAFYQNEVADYEITEFVPVKSALGFEQFVRNYE
jgi:uncharacterized protein YciI